MAKYSVQKINMCKVSIQVFNVNQKQKQAKKEAKIGEYIKKKLTLTFLPTRVSPLLQQPFKGNFSYNRQLLLLYPHFFGNMSIDRDIQIQEGPLSSSFVNSVL